MKLRVLGTLLGRRDDSQFYRASREEARFREAEWDNYLHHGPRASRIIITDSSIASDANAPPWSLHDSDTQDKTLISTNT